jgi:outer membrane protein assembly factor BamA
VSIQYFSDIKIDNRIELPKTAKDSIDVIRIAQKIINQYRDNSYLTASVDSIIYTSKDSATLFLNIGKVFSWSKLSKGNISDEALSKVNYRENIYFNRPFKGKETGIFLENLLKYYENNGFPFAQIRLNVKEIDDHGLIADLNVEKGPEYKIDSILIYGNSKVGERFLYNYIGLKPGSVYNETLINDIGTRLDEIPFLVQTRPYEVQFFEKESKVLIYLKKKPASRFDGILGVLTNEETGKIDITGNIELNLKNAIGKGEAFDLEWRKLIGETQNLKIHLNYPFLFNTPFGVDAGFELYKRDTLFLDVSFKLGLQYVFKGYDYIQIFIKNNSSRRLGSNTTSSAPLLNLPPYADYNSILYGIEYNKEKLNYRYNPQRGYQLNINASTGNKKIQPIPSLQETNPSIYEDIPLKSSVFQGKFDGSYYIPIAKRSVIKLRNQMGYLFNESLFDNELFRIGGIKTLRGFDEESIFASSYIIGTIEYRFILDKNSSIYLFSDGGYYEKIKTTINDTPIGFGVGMNFQTGAGIFSINYAVGKQFDNPIDFRASKIHFGFVNFF